MKKSTLSIPLSNKRVAKIPFPMIEEDFNLLVSTLALWKKHMEKPTAHVPEQPELLTINRNHHDS